MFEFGWLGIIKASFIKQLERGGGLRLHKVERVYEIQKALYLLYIDQLRGLF